MLESNYIKIYTGSFIIAQLIIDQLEAIGISPVIKDETESGRLAGFSASVPGYQELYVRQEELDTAIPVVENVTKELQA
jgi:hypothetical protein